MKQVLAGFLFMFGLVIFVPCALTTWSYLHGSDVLVTAMIWRSFWVLFGLFLMVNALGLTGIRIPIATALCRRLALGSLVFVIPQLGCLPTFIMFFAISFALDPSGCSGGSYSSNNNDVSGAAFAISVLMTVAFFSIFMSHRITSSKFVKKITETMEASATASAAGPTAPPPQLRRAIETLRGKKPEKHSEPTVGLDVRKARHNVGCFGYGIAGCVVIPIIFFIVIVIISDGHVEEGGIFFALTVAVTIFASIPVLRVAWASRKHRKKFGPIYAQRAEAMEDFAEQLKLSYKEVMLPSEVRGTSGKGTGAAEAYRLWESGSSYPLNVMGGLYRGEPLRCFDHHDYMWRLGKKTVAQGGGIEKDPLDFTVICFKLPKSFPKMVIYPEALWDKLAKRGTGIDIDLESIAFSDDFRVWSQHRRFAYAVCNSLLMDFLMSHEGLSFKLQDDLLSFAFSDLADIDTLRQCLDTIVKADLFVPHFLYDDDAT